MDARIVVKAIGGVLIIGSCALSGAITASSYRERVQAISDFRRRMKIMADEIRFRKGVLEDALQKAGEGKGLAAGFFREAAVYVKTMDAQSAWDLACDGQGFASPMKDEELQVIRSLGEQLGMSDVEGQLANIESVDSRLASIEEKAEEQRAKNEPLFRKIGFLVGAAIVILLI